MCTTVESLPIIDLSSVNATVEIREVAEKEIEIAAKEICDALTTIGFAYIRNHGIGEEEIDQVRKLGDQFFSLDDDVKRKYYRPDDDYWGWNPIARERIDPTRPPDLHETYNISPRYVKVWPEEVPGLREHCMIFFDQCSRLGHRLLNLIAIGLHLQDEDYFSKCHNFATRENMTGLRFLNYPALWPDTVIKPGEVRLGEHSDYGSITLLFQDDAGGLEVRARCNEYIEATPIPGTMLINIGDMMQRWTNDKLVSTRHRVLIPEDEVKRRTARRSMAFFVQPDEDAVIQSIEGSTKYDQITFGDYLKMRFNQAY